MCVSHMEGFYAIQRAEKEFKEFAYTTVEQKKCSDSYQNFFVVSVALSARDSAND